jgi:RNA polymerase sigma factor (sigma-70 family)
MTLTDMTTDRTDDESLVQAVQGGNLQAFELLVQRHLDHLHAFVSIKLPVPHLVDEITHESFVFAFHRIDQFAPGTNFRAWLRAIALNKTRAEIERYCREERNRLAYTERRVLEAAALETSLPDSRELEALQECLRDVPEKAHALLSLKYHDESSTAEIAQRLQRSLAWVRTTLCRIRQQLKECVENKLKVKPS